MQQGPPAGTRPFPSFEAIYPESMSNAEQASLMTGIDQMFWGGTPNASGSNSNSRSSGGGNSSGRNSTSSNNPSSGRATAAGHSSADSRSHPHGRSCSCCQASEMFLDANLALATVGMYSSVAPGTVDSIKPYLKVHVAAAAEHEGLVGAHSTSNRRAADTERSKALLLKLRKSLNQGLADISQQLPSGLTSASKQKCQLMRTAVEQALAAVLAEQQPLPSNLDEVFQATCQLARASFAQQIVAQNTNSADLNAVGLFQETSRICAMLGVRRPDWNNPSSITDSRNGSSGGHGSAAVAPAAVAATAASSGSSSKGSSSTYAATAAAAAPTSVSASWGTDGVLAGLKGLFQRANSGSSSSSSKQEGQDNQQQQQKSSPALGAVVKGAKQQAVEVCGCWVVDSIQRVGWTLPFTKYM